jgi:hypothetical protein
MTSTSSTRSLVQRGPIGRARAGAHPRRRHRAPFVLVGVLTALLAAAIPGAPAARAAEPESSAPSPIEQALMEFACRVPGQAAPTPAVDETCLAGQLVGLRTDFGRDLQKLSSAERKGIDAACSAVRTARGRDAYVGCMSQQLAALRSKRAKTAAPAAAASAPAEPPATPIEEMAALLPPVTEPPLTESSSSLWVGLLAFAGIAGGGWYLVAGRPRRPAVHLCRVCGGDVGTAGDMCANCRHEAAEAQRRGQADRAQATQAVADEARRMQEEAQARLLLEEEEARRVQALAQQAELARQQEEARSRDEELRRWQSQAVAAIAGPVESVFDPLAVLGLPASPSEEQTRKAYDEARAKYAPDQVAHLGIELQDHYRKKAEAVERAFEMLSSPARA